MKRISVSLPDLVYAKLEVLAAQRNVSLQELVEAELSHLAESLDEVWETERAGLHARLAGYHSDGPFSRDEIYADRLKPSSEPSA